VRFSLNRIVAPKLAFADFLALCQGLGIDDIELRNDLRGIEFENGASATAIGAQVRDAGLTVRTINALQRFEQFDAQRAEEACMLADTAVACGSQALVLCPTNSSQDVRSAGQRHDDLVQALSALKPILKSRGLLGFVEPLGFDICATRTKAQAVRAIDEVGGSDVFSLVHDTFHHHLAGEQVFFANRTGLVHVSGVEAPSLSVGEMGDPHRVLVGELDRLGTVSQLKRLMADGYDGIVSFEPFAAEVAESKNIEAELRASIDFIRFSLAA
jgi:2-keto-myo-inositol isomerase